MIDQTTPPFAAGDVAYTRPAPGGYASAAAVPTDPAFAGTDKAYAVPSLGGEFQPGSGKPAPTNSAISKGADADGGAADIAGATRIDVPPAPTPPAVVPLAVTVSGFDLIFSGVADVAKILDVAYKLVGNATNFHIANIAVPLGSSAGATAALVAGRCNSSANLTAAQTSNAVRVGAKTPNVLDTAGFGCTITAAVELEAEGTPPPPEDDPEDEDDEDEETQPLPGKTVVRKKARKSK